MILLVHDNEKVTELIDLELNQVIKNTLQNPLEALFNIAKTNTDRILIWCQKSQKSNINIEGIKQVFKLKNMMMSYCKSQYIPEQIGYVEESPFLKINKKVKYPTWLMSSNVGAIHASQLLKFKGLVSIRNTFDFSLNAIAKMGMPNGLFCYSEPRLLNSINTSKDRKATNYELFKFVKHHYKWVWSFLLLINMMINEYKFPLISFLRTLFIRKKIPSLEFDLIPLQKKKTEQDLTIDVIIPTLGRKEYLHNVLLDLSNQTILPKQVIIVEQNDDASSESELDFIKHKTWPFKIIHNFIHQTGACNARNLALQKVTANYVYLADDDNKFGSNLLEDIINKMQCYNFDVITMSYLQKKEKEKHKAPLQWSTFGGGSSVVSSKYLKKIAFNMALEFGYGEDSDFGMQLRNLGADVIYTPDINILHLKAPIGGFRTKFSHPWDCDTIQPKPSPTVMYYRIKNTTKQQLLGYRTNLFLQFYKSQDIKNPFKYFKNYKKQWKSSEVWAKTLKNNMEA